VGIATWASAWPARSAAASGAMSADDLAFMMASFRRDGSAAAA
jgi:hypothetical protein